MAYALLGSFFADRERYPTVPPEFAEHVGWLAFGLLVAVLLWGWTRAESVRRAVFALEDPRTFAVLRIGFAVMTFVCFLNLFPYWRMLWSDEGIFDLLYAQERLGRAALRGWSPDEGFFDIWAVANFLWHKPSLFYIYGSPTFLYGFMAVFFAVLGLYAVGFASRVTGVVSWLMMSMLYNRNALYWEGTDTVYRCFWLILLFAKTGHAWSFDNWWRCRALRRRGRLQLPEDASDETEHTRARKEPIYRLIPSWPRYLFMLQLAALYISTGAVKTGHVWLQGDALYYALNMDHFYRFEGPTQLVSSIFGMNLFRVNTWVTHWWEQLFPFVLVGVALRFGLRHEHEPWYRAQNVWWRKWLGRLALALVYALVYRITLLAVPFCLTMIDDVPQDSGSALQKIHLAFGVIVPLGVLAWFALGRWPVRLLRGGRSLGKLTARYGWARLPEIHIDREQMRRWLLGRRVWLTLGLFFHGFLILFMNIGMFPFIMLMTYAGFVSGEETTGMFRWTVKTLRKWPALRRAVPAQTDRLLVDAQDPRDVPVCGRKLPDALVLVFGAAGLGLLYARIDNADWVETGTYLWLGAMAMAALAFRFSRPRPIDHARAREPGPALAYGAFGRTLAVGAVVWHSMAVATHLFPAYAIFTKWRSPARAVFSSWLGGTGTTQSWRMFAPNPPRANMFMKTVVVLDNGEHWNLRNNAWDYRPDPWIINDRMRKMQRRMVGKGKWYLRYWAHFQCREWERLHGESPQEVKITKIVTSIPSPQIVSYWQPAKFRGRIDPRTGVTSGQPYEPRKLKSRETDVQTHKCRGDGELPLHIKERYGLPVTDADRTRAEREATDRARKFTSRRDRWEKRRDWGRWFADDEDKV